MKVKLEDIVWKIMVGIATQHTPPSDKDKFVKEIKKWAKGIILKKETVYCPDWNNCRDKMLKSIEAG